MHHRHSFTAEHPVDYGRLVRALLVLVATLLPACGGLTTSPDAGAWYEAELSPCRIGGDAPRSVDDVIARLNALPRPVTVPCFTASLPRPVGLLATTSRFSAQPAGSNETPRLFLITDSLVLSVVADGPGKDLLELGELVGGGRSLKAELKFPFDGPVSREEAYSHLEFSPSTTSCGLCHTAEQPHPAHRFARTSVALRAPARTVLPLEGTRRLAQTCDVTSTRDRCLRWMSVFGFGEVSAASFPADFGDFIR